MSLLLLTTGSPAISYDGCPDPSTPGQLFFSSFCTIPRTFQESMSSAEGFFYDPGTDTYNLVARLNQIFWPSWKYNYYSISATTGLQVQKLRIEGGAIDFSWTGNRRAGGFKKVYAQRIFNPINAIVEITPTIGLPTASQLANPIITDADVGGRSLGQAVINRDQKIVGLVESFDFVTIDYTSNTVLKRLRLPENGVVDTAYEDDQRCWILMTDTSGGLIVVKINYILGRVELMSRLQDSDSGPDISASIAFDTRRKNVAVFRRRNDNSDGSPAHIVEIYKPIALANILTEPVPVTAVLPNKQATFVAHVAGDKGEAGSGVKVTASTAGVGKIKKGTSTSRGGGSVVLPYDAGNKNLTDTITLEINC